MRFSSFIYHCKHLFLSLDVIDVLPTTRFWNFIKLTLVNPLKYIVVSVNGLGDAIPRYKAAGIRLDSGDLAYLSSEARKIFNIIEKEFGVPEFGKTLITASNDLNEETLDALNKQVMTHSCSPWIFLFCFVSEVWNF